MKRFSCAVILLIIILHARSAEVPGWNMTNLWTARIEGGCDSTPAVGDDGTVYLGTQGGRLVAINPDGSRKWLFKTRAEILSSPAVSKDGIIYFGCRDGELRALRTDGKLLWSFKTDGWMDSSPALGTEGVVYIGSWDGSFYAINPNGTQKWKFATGHPIDSSAAISIDGTLYFGSHDGKLYALSPQGYKLWEFATHKPIVSSAAVTASGSICFSSLDGFLYMLNRDGSMQWRLHTGSITRSSPIIGDGESIYIGVNTSFWKISAKGEKIAEWDSRDFVEGSGLIQANGTVCRMARNGFVSGVNEKTPAKNWYSIYYTERLASLAIGRTGTLYLPAEFHYFCALDGRSPLARSAWPKFRGNLRNTGNIYDNLNEH